MSEHRAVDALRELARRLPCPRAIVIVSAHWIDNPIGVTAGRSQPTIHDFGGFPQPLYEMEYAATGDDALSPDVARRIHHSFTYGNLGMSCFEFCDLAA